MDVDSTQVYLPTLNIQLALVLQRWVDNNIRTSRRYKWCCLSIINKTLYQQCDKTFLLCFGPILNSYWKAIANWEHYKVIFDMAGKDVMVSRATSHYLEMTGRKSEVNANKL